MELPFTVPVMVLPSATLFPQSLLPLYIFEAPYRKLLADALHGQRLIAIAMQKPGRVRQAPYPVAGLGLIRVSVAHADGTSHLVLQGLTRVELGKAVRSRPYRVHPIRPLRAEPTDSLVIDALVGKLLELVEQRIRQGAFGFPLSSALKKSQAAPKLGPGKPTTLSAKQIMRYLKHLRQPEQVADLVTCALLPNARERQAILETVEIEPRLKRVVQFLLAEIHRPPKNSPL
jgi:ATP-dependent Lon protease